MSLAVDAAMESIEAMDLSDENKLELAERLRVEALDKDEHATAITHEALKALLEDLKAVESREGDYLAALDSAVDTVEGWVEELSSGL